METIAEFLARTARERQGQDAAAAGIVISTVDKNPDQFAGDMTLAQDWAKETGKPVPPMPLVEEYRPVFQQQIEAKRNSTVLAGNPKLAAWLRDPQNSALARDDLEGLSFWEGKVLNSPGALTRAVGRGAERVTTIPGALAGRMNAEVANDIGKTFDQILAEEAAKYNGEVPPALMGDVRRKAQLRFDMTDGLTEVDRDRFQEEARAQFQSVVDTMKRIEAVPMSEAASRFRDETLKSADNTLMGVLSAFGSDPSGGISFLLETAAESIPQIGAAGVATLAAGPGAGVATMGAASFLTESTTETVQFLREKNIDLTTPEAAFQVLGDQSLLQEAVDRGLARGMIVGLLDAVSGGVAGQQLAKSALGNLFLQSLAQAGLGGAGEAGAQMATDGTLNWADIVTEALAEFATSPIEIAALGGAKLTEVRRNQIRAKEAAAREAQITEIAQASMASKLRARMPDVFRAWVERATENGPAENLYVPADKFTEYFQSIGMDPYALADEMDGVGRADLETALATGGDLRIPTSTYAAKLAGSDADQFFMENMRFDPDEFTSAEARAFEDTKAELMAEAMNEAEKIFADQQELRTYEQEIFDTMVERLRIAGRATDVATTEAALYPAFYKVMAERAGIPLGEFIRRYPLPQVRGDIPQGMQARDVDDLTRTLATARAQREAGVNQPRTPLLEFISNWGGISDMGGELAARDAAVVKRGRGRKSLRLQRDPALPTRDAALRGYGPDDVAQAAIEAGLMADNPIVMEYQRAMAAGDPVPDITQAIWEEIDKELRGEASTRAEDMNAGPSQDDQIAEMERYLAELGVSLDDDDAVIRQAIERDQAAQRRMYGQDGLIATDSEAFKAWFGDSVVTGPGGEPLVVYHGTDRQFEAFNADAPSATGVTTRAFFFTESQGVADGYGDNVMPVYLKIESPVELDFGGKSRVFFDGEMRSPSELAARIAEINDDLAIGAFDLDGDLRYELEGAGWDYLGAETIDGLVLKNVDDSMSMFGGEITTHYVAFTPTQIKSVNNRGTFDASDPRILYQGANEVATALPEQPLYVVHNLSAEKLRYATELGGLAAPSIAIARGDIGFDQFGEISLIGDPSMADPKKKGVRAFNADVYSPRQPRARFKVKEKDANRVFKAVRSVADDLDLRTDMDISGMERDGLSSISANMGIKAAWLRSLGEDIPARRNREIAQYVPKERGDVDQYQTMIAIDAQIAGREDQYSDWVRSEFGDVIGDAYFEDANGRRRDYTMANIVREMTRGLRDAEGFNYGVGNVRATVAPEFRTMAEIKAAREQIVTEQAMDALKTEVGNELFALADKFAPYHSSGKGFGWGDIFSEFLKDMGKGRRFVDQWQATIFSEPVPDELLAEAAAYLQKLRDLPTEYFEIKMQRAVSLGEFKVALVPEKASAETVKTLTDAGVEVLRYGVEGRQAALQRVAGKVFFQPAYHGSPHLFERFSLEKIGTGEGAQAFGWGLYFAGRKEVAEYYRNALSARAGNMMSQRVEVNGTEIPWTDLSQDEKMLVAVMSDNGNDWQKAYDAIPDDFLPTAVDRYRAALLEMQRKGYTFKPHGRLFEVDIPEDAELLDWDAPLSKQPEGVRDALDAILPPEYDLGPAQDYRNFTIRNVKGPRGGNPIGSIRQEGETFTAFFDGSEIGKFTSEGDAFAAVANADGGRDNMTGATAYKLLSRELGSDATASEALRAAGIPGHRYLDGGSRADGDGTRNYVIYDDSRIQVTRFEQEQRGSVAFPSAGVGNGDTVVSLFRKADLSTFLHESGHYFLTVMQDMAGKGEASAVAEFDTIKAWWRSNAAAVAKDAMRVMPDVKVTEADVISALDNGTTGDVLKDAAIDVGMQEQFARGFEAYLMEGKAPSVELRGAFEKFRAWLLSVYRSLRGLNVEIDDNIRAVFDRMLATDEQIAEARTQTGDRGPMFTEAPAGMSPEDWDRYQAIGQAAQDEAAARLLAETMAPIRREQEQAYRAEKENVRADVEPVVNARREYRAIEWMGNRRWLGADQPQGLPDMRLDRQTLVDRYGEGVLKTLPRGKFTLYANEGGVDPEIAAGLFGFGSADEMIRALERAPKRSEAITAEVEKLMFERHGDPLRDGTVEAKAIEAVHGDKRARMLAIELDVLRAAPGGTKSAVSVFREMARGTLAGMRVRDAMAANRYLTAERKAGEASYRAASAGDLPAAAEAKRRQLLNHMLYTEARKIEAEVEAAEKLAARLQKKSVREKLAGDYLEAIDEILGRYDFRRISGKAEDRRGALLAYVERMKAEGRENELAIPERVLQDAARTPYKRLTVEHLRGVVDSLKNIEHTARLKQKLIDAQSQRDLDAVVDDILGAFDDNVKPQPPGRVGTTGERFRSGVRGFIDLVLNAGTLLREIDGFKDLGPAFSNIKAPIDAAMNRLQARREKAAIDLDALYDVYTKDERRKMAVRQFVPEIGASLSKWERIAVALNMGNEGNYQRLTDTKVRGGFTEAQVKAIIASLDARDARFVQSVWDYLDGYRADIAAREKRVTGIEPKWVEGRPVQIGGVDLKGGYYPLKYDARMSSLARDDAAQDIAKSLQSGRFGKAQTRNGHLKERATSSGRPVELDISVLHRHVQQVVYDLELSEPVSNSWRILQDGRIRDAFVNAGKQADFDALEIWLKDVAEGELRAASEVGQLARRFKSNFTAAKLAFNLSTVAVQITGVAQSMVVVGKADFLKGVQMALRPGIRDEVHAKSIFMRDRSTTFNKDIFDLYNDPRLGPVASRWTEIRNDWIAPAGFWLMTKVQSYLVDVPTWLAGYQQGLRKFGNDEAKAIAYADDIVKRSQASGLFSDRSAIERGSADMRTRQNEFLRLFTTLGSYMFAKFNVAYERTGRARQVIDREGLSLRSAQEAVSWTIDVAFLFTLEAVLYAAIKGRLPDEEDDEDDDGMADEWAAYLAKETALSLMSTIPFVRDIGSVLTGFGGGGAYGAITEELGKPLVQINQGEVDKALVKSVISATGLFTGLPSGQINRAVEAGWRQAEGEDVSPAEYLLGRMGN